MLRQNGVRWAYCRLARVSPSCDAFRLRVSVRMHGATKLKRMSFLMIRRSNVAVKVINKQRMSAAKLRSRVVNEVEMLASSSHPGIVQYIVRADRSQASLWSHLQSIIGSIHPIFIAHYPWRIRGGNGSMFQLLQAKWTSDSIPRKGSFCLETMRFVPTMLIYFLCVSYFVLQTSGETRRHVAVVMELCKGGDMFQLMRRALRLRQAGASDSSSNWKRTGILHPAAV